MFEKLKQNYLSTFTDKIVNIEQALESSDIQVLSTQIHQMIGSSGSYGFLEISQHCTQIEKQILDSHEVNPSLRNAVNRLIDIMRQELNESNS